MMPTDYKRAATPSTAPLPPAPAETVAAAHVGLCGQTRQPPTKQKPSRHTQQQRQHTHSSAVNTHTVSAPPGKSTHLAWRERQCTQTDGWLPACPTTVFLAHRCTGHAGRSTCRRPTPLVGAQPGGVWRLPCRCVFVPRAPPHRLQRGAAHHAATCEPAASATARGGTPLSTPWRRSAHDDMLSSGVQPNTDPPCRPQLPLAGAGARALVPPWRTCWGRK